MCLSVQLRTCSVTVAGTAAGPSRPGGRAVATCINENRDRIEGETELSGDCAVGAAARDDRIGNKQRVRRLSLQAKCAAFSLNAGDEVAPLRITADPRAAVTAAAARCIIR